jgi:hypothetical protein
MRLVGLLSPLQQPVALSHFEATRGALLDALCNRILRFVERLTALPREIPLVWK